MEVNKNGMSLILNKNENEPDDIFYARLWFIISQDNLDNFDEVERLSRIWANIKYLGCKYHPVIYHKIMAMEKKFMN